MKWYEGRMCRDVVDGVRGGPTGMGGDEDHGDDRGDFEVTAQCHYMRLVERKCRCSMNVGPLTVALGTIAMLDKDVLYCTPTVVYRHAVETEHLRVAQAGCPLSLFLAS